MMRGTWRALPTALVLLGLGACGGGGGSGQPKNLSLQGLKIPTAQVVTNISTLCAVDQQAHAGTGDLNGAFYGGASGEPHLVLHQLAAVLASSHHAASADLLAKMVTFEQDLLVNPVPEPKTGLAADALLRSASAGLTDLRVKPPACATGG